MHTGEIKVELGLGAETWIELLMTKLRMRPLGGSGRSSSKDCKKSSSTVDRHIQDIRSSHERLQMSHTTTHPPRCSNKSYVRQILAAGSCVCTRDYHIARWRGRSSASQRSSGTTLRHLHQSQSPSRIIAHKDVLSPILLRTNMVTVCRCHRCG